MYKNTPISQVEKVEKGSKHYYLDKGLSEAQKTAIDKILEMPLTAKEVIANVININAQAKGLPLPGITLRNAQIDPVLLSYVNPRFFIGDKPGLGKTVMSAGSYAYYCIQERKKGREPKKVIVVTVSSHVIGFAKEWESFGIKLLPLTKASQGIRRAFKNNDISDYDGVIINWDSLKTNGFLEHYLRHSDLYGYGVFDETSRLLNPRSSIYKVVNNLVNNYQGGLERVIFLNGSSFEKDIFDFYHQFNILQPKLIPTKSFLEERYIIRKGRNIYVNDVVTRNGTQSVEVVSRKIGEIEGYINQEELRDRLKYYYIARSKRDYSDDLPEHSYVLHPVEPTLAQLKALDERFIISSINSPATSDPSKKMTMGNSPKLQQIVAFADETSEDRPILYVYNREAQHTIKAELEKLGYKVGILNGGSGDALARNKIVTDFNNKKYDMLVFNIINAINLPTSSRILFYDIPMMPQTTNQIKGRIDRDNYTDKKFYDFFCYLYSPEMVNMVQLACFREYHSGKFTGQYENIYGMLVAQLARYVGNEAMDNIEKLVHKMYETNSDFDEITSEIRGVIGL